MLIGAQTPKKCFSARLHLLASSHCSSNQQCFCVCWFFVVSSSMVFPYCSSTTLYHVKQQCCFCTVAHTFLFRIDKYIIGYFSQNTRLQICIRRSETEVERNSRSFPPNSKPPNAHKMVCCRLPWEWKREKKLISFRVKSTQTHTLERKKKKTHLQIHNGSVRQKSSERMKCGAASRTPTKLYISPTFQLSQCMFINGVLKRPKNNTEWKQ